MVKLLQNGGAKVACFGLLMGVLTIQAQAAPVTFSGPIAIGSGSGTATLYNGPEIPIVYAVNMAPTGSNGLTDISGAPASPATINTTDSSGNTLTFRAVNTAGSNATTTAVEGRGNDPGAPNYTGNVAFDSILHSDAFSLGGANMSVTLSGLTQGLRYEVQLFFARNLGSGFSTTITAPDGGSNSVTYDVGANNPSYVLGTFFADATTTQTISINAGVSGVTYLSALVVRQVVPEVDPRQGFIPLALLAMLGLAYRDRRRARATAL